MIHCSLNLGIRHLTAVLLALFTALIPLSALAETTLEYVGPSLQHPPSPEVTSVRMVIVLHDGVSTRSISLAGHSRESHEGKVFKRAEITLGRNTYKFQLGAYMDGDLNITFDAAGNVSDWQIRYFGGPNIALYGPGSVRPRNSPREQDVPPRETCPNVDVVASIPRAIGCGAGSWTVRRAGGDAPVAAVIRLPDGTDIANNSQSPERAVVGQRIELVGAVEGMPPGVAVSRQVWNVEGVTVGGFEATLSSGRVIPTSFSQPQAVFYWVSPGSTTPSPRKVTYTAQLSNGTSVSAESIFRVAIPRLQSATVRLGTVRIDRELTRDANGQSRLVSVMSFGTPLGSSGGSSGISIAANASAPAGLPGTFSWIQLVDSKVTEFAVSKNSTCETNGMVLDGIYLFANGLALTDSPGVRLGDDAVQINRNLSARTYLMWNPTLPGACTPPQPQTGSGNCSSIPVPLGYVDWGFEAFGFRGRNNQWSPSGTARPSASIFQNSLEYPQWNDYVLPGTAHGLTCQ